MPAPIVSVIIVNYNGGAYLHRCLESLRRQVHTDFEVIVVDNGSRDGSFERARADTSDSRFRFVALGHNLGFAAANNRAVAEARGRWLALLNLDAFAEPDWLQVLMGATTRYPDVMMFGSTQIDACDPARLDGIGDHYFAAGLPWRGGFGYLVSALPAEREVFGPCAAAALYRADLFRSLAGFDERFFMYCEDVDFAFRARLRGAKCVQISAARVQHVGSAIAGDRSAFALYYGTRNLILTFVKNMPSVLFWPLLPFHAVVILVLLVRAATVGHALAVSRGICAALVVLPDFWKSRRRCQATRTVTLRSMIAVITWNPWYPLRRAPV